MRRVTVVTAKHLATTPRMLKAADALQEAGYDVRVVSVSNSHWGAGADEAIHKSRRWRWTVVPGMREQAPISWLASGARFRMARAIAPRVGSGVRRTLAPHAVARMHLEIVRAILSEPQDLIYAGTSGALSAAIRAARISGVPCGVDFEDFHCGEQERDARGVVLDELAGFVMQDAVRDAAFITAGSTAIADACGARFGRRPVPVHNVFPLPAHAPSPARRDGPLRLYWFSQTIGPFRGLEEAVQAAGRADVPCELHLRGDAVPGYAATLQTQAATAAPRLRLFVHAPAPPESMVDACRDYDVGLATEQAHIPNRALALTNKALTYPLAGLGVAFTDTPGQRQLAHDAGEGAIVYGPGDVDRLADGLARWATDATELRRAKEASWEAARRRWHWHHPDERGALIDLVRGS
jgi:hypothetical protein